MSAATAEGLTKHSRVNVRFRQKLPKLVVSPNNIRGTVVKGTLFTAEVNILRSSRIQKC